MVGCIEIEDNVFVGANSLVNKDLDSDSVYAGIPAKKIGNFQDYIKRYQESNYINVRNNQNITLDEIKGAWSSFYQHRKH